MKYLIIVFLFLGCSQKYSKELPVQNNIVEVHKCEPVIIHDTITITQFKTVFVEKRCDSLISVIKKKNDSLFIERYKLERVKYYNGIVKKNKTQLKFLSGWITRATK